ncbi:hypothetical protein DERP_000882 [Dermatophagoides pteronyssinus]|uniref:Uncharacterized protein n=1 Tax=Dermatophagoides pteronyssinus TaxID=6956 RepID=A0ABQ8J1E7_DERPT|nr:hypothetical protein DERP_000882 [Dermatophagoides pteronyssinus]
MSSQHLTKWQRFKIWTTKYFGCKSSSTYVFNNNEQNDNSERPSKQSGQRIQPSKSINETKSLGVMDLHDDNGQDIPFIDASLINLDRIVK